MSFEEKHLKRLVGKTVVGLVRDGGSSYTDECWGLRFSDGTVAWIQCDPEGNGPGFLAIDAKALAAQKG
jgi:hypothetical protein